MKGKQEGRTKKVKKKSEKRNYVGIMHGKESGLYKKKRYLRGVHNWIYWHLSINFRYFPVQYLEWQVIIRKRGHLIPFREEDSIPNYWQHWSPKKLVTICRVLRMFSHLLCIQDKQHLSSAVLKGLFLFMHFKLQQFGHLPQFLSENVSESWLRNWKGLFSAEVKHLLGFSGCAWTFLMVLLLSLL